LGLVQWTIALHVRLIQTSFLLDSNSGVHHTTSLT
jgi:hypothetical protein